MKVFNYIALALSLFLISCNSNEIKDLKWMEGTWKHEFNGNVQIIKWTCTEKAVTGKILIEQNDDSNLMENITIMKENDKIVYTSDYTENEMMVEFPMKEMSNNKIVFHKTNYDWPQDISYELQNDSLIVTLSGKSNNQVKTAVFSYHK